MVIFPRSTFLVNVAKQELLAVKNKIFWEAMNSFLRRKKEENMCNVFQ